MEANILSGVIKKRRAVPPRLFAKTEVPKEVIGQLLENATWAPNHKKTEPWRFKVYTGNAKRILAQYAEAILLDNLAKGYPVAHDKIKKFSSTLERVPVAIAIVLQRDAAHRVPEWEEIAAVSMAVQNMWLTATELGLAAFWATPPFVELLDEQLDIDNGQKCLGFFYVGNLMMDYPSPGREGLSGRVEWYE